MKGILLLLTPTIFVYGISVYPTKAQNTLPSLHIQKATGKIILDGSLDEQDWSLAEVAGDFMQYFPYDTSLADSQTEIRLTYDDEFLYMGAKMYNLSSDRKYVTPSLRRDFRGEANDGITLILDPFQDKTNAFQFGVNPFGVQREGLVANGGSGGGQNLSLSWDNKWYTKATQYEGYWIAELAIPFKTIRFKENSQKWNMNFYRIDSENGERSSWAHIPRNFGIITLAFNREVVFDKPLKKPGPNISVIPFVSSAYEHDREEGLSPARSADFGGDAKIGIGPSLNLDLTFNPDFSQVEVDDQVTNLDRFEIFYPEKRQFFLENADLFADFGTRNLRPFFSRRIGVTRDETTGQNLQNKIHAGARLSGKVNKNWRVGLLNMLAAKDDDLGVPSTNYSVASFQRKLFARSNVGMILVNRDPTAPLLSSSGADSVRPYNRVLGIDYNLASANNRWNGKLFAHRSFSNENLNDAFALSAEMEYNTLLWEISSTTQSIGANYNPETGFARRNDFNRFAQSIWYNFYPDSRIVNRHGPGFDTDNIWNQDYGTTDRDLNLMYRIQFKNTALFNMRLRHDYVYLFFSFDPTNTGGVELSEGSEFGFYSVIANYSSDARKKFFYNLSTRSGEYYNGTRANMDSELGYRIQPYGIISLVTNVNRLRLPFPYNDADLLLIGPKFDVTLSKSLFITTYFQYNNQINNVNVNARLQWRFKPVSDIFLVYTENYLPETFYSRNRSLIFKATYWLNI